MTNLIRLSTLALSVFLLTGCASVQIFSDTGLNSKTGLKFYNPKPYLLVELKAEKDLTIKTTIVYLPDVLNPQYLKVKPGIGSNELKVAFTNGTLNSYGLTTSSEIPETLTAMTNLLAKSATLAGQLGGVAGPGQPGEENFILYEIVFSKEGASLKKVKILE